MGKAPYELRPELKRTAERLQGPLATALGACAIGFGIGLILPSSDPERRMLGRVPERVAETIGGNREPP